MPIAALLFALIASAPPPSLPSGYTLIPGSFEAGREPDGNSVIVDAPDGLIVVDTGRHPPHRQAILDAAASARRPIAAIVNSHWHLDHTGGNAALRAAFPQARIIASRAVEAALTGFLAQSRKDAQAYLDSGKADAGTAEDIRLDMAAMDERTSLLPTDPVTASGPRRIAGRKFIVHLAPHAATAGDVWLYDPAARTLIAGDLVVAFAPFLDTACAEGWRNALADIAATSFEVLIPGHGAPMDRAGFDRWRSAFDALLDCARSTAADAVCIAGWRRDAAPFFSGIAPQRIDGMIGYYLQSRLRAPPAERERYCSGA